MKLIENNPFRILGVKANATPSEIRQQGNLIAQYLKIGQSAKLDFDITPPLNPIERTTQLIELQSSRIHSTEDKILHSLFWFVQDSGVDKIALAHLTKSKDITKALTDFEKGCRGFVAGPDSYSAILNHSTLEIIAFKQHGDLNRLKDAIAHKFSIVSNSETLALLKRLVAPDGLSTNVPRILELAMPRLEELLKELVPSENPDRLTLEIFKTNTVIYPQLKNDAIEAKVKRINRLVDRTEADREKMLDGGYSSSMLTDVPLLGESLMDEVRAPLSDIDSFLGKDDPVYADMMEKVFTEVNYCGVLPFNKFVGKVNSNITAGLSIDGLKREADLSKIVALYNRAISEMGFVTVPVKETMLNNRSGIKEAHDELKYTSSSSPPKPPYRPQMPPPQESEGLSTGAKWLIGIVAVIFLVGIIGGTEALEGLGSFALIVGIFIAIGFVRAFISNLFR